MTILLPEDYHARRWLESHRISCITQAEGKKQQIRALRIGFIDLTPQKKNHLRSLLIPMGRSILHLEPIWLSLQGLDLPEWAFQHTTYEEANRKKTLDGLLIMGDIDPNNPYSSGETLPCWNELQNILTLSRQNIISTLGISLGGIAISHHLGIASETIDPPLHGIYRSYGINRSHPITGDFDDEFFCPQHRLFHIDESTFRFHEQRGRLSLLADSEEGGFFIFGTPDYRLIAHLGDPTADPQTYGVKENNWRSHLNELIASWVKYLYLANDY